MHPNEDESQLAVIPDANEARLGILQRAIDARYDEVFASPDHFKQYFFATPDQTPEDAQIRLGVYLTRLVREPSERFWFMRHTYRGESLPKDSIHTLEYAGDSSSFALNGCTEFQIQAWRKEQPREIEK